MTEGQTPRPTDPAAGRADRLSALHDLGQEVVGDGVSGTLMERMGIELQEVDAHRASGRMRVEGNVQPYGLLHGGASAVLAETLGSFAAAVHAGPGRAAVGIELSCTHHRATREGSVTGVATAVHLGGSLATYEIVITDEADRRICTARLTCLIRERPPA